MTIVKRMKLAGWQAQPSVECMVEIEIDEDRLASLLGNKAFRNRSKKSRAQQGLIKCSVRPITSNV